MASFETDSISIHLSFEKVHQNFKIFMEKWIPWYGKLEEMEDLKSLVCYCKGIKPAFERILPVFETFERDWCLFSEKYPDLDEDVASLKRVAEKQAILTQKMHEVLQNINEASLKICQ